MIIKRHLMNWVRPYISGLSCKTFSLSCKIKTFYKKENGCARLILLHEEKNYDQNKHVMLYELIIFQQKRK